MPPDLQSYFASLHERRKQAKPLRHRNASTEDWTSKRACCHANVAFVVGQCPRLKPVRGWIIVSEDASGRCRFAAHSVIDDGGQLYDVTLSDQAECDLYRFLEHVGAEEDFWAVERVCRDTEYPFFRPEDLDTSGAEEDIRNGESEDMRSDDESEF